MKPKHEMERDIGINFRPRKGDNVKSSRGTNDLLLSDQTRQGLRLNAFGDETLQAKYFIGLEKIESPSILSGSYVIIPLLLYELA